MSSQKKDKGDKDDESKGSKEKPVKVSKYLPLEESESSESSRRSTPSEDRPAVEASEPSASGGASKGAVVALPPSRSWTATSFKMFSVTDTKGVSRSQSTDKGTFKPNFNPAGTSKAGEKRTSPLKGSKGKAKSPPKPRSRSISPLKKIAQMRQSRARKAEEKKRLLDHPDGELKVALPPKPSVEFKYTGPMLTSKDTHIPDRVPSDDESTSKSSVSETSSVWKATRDLIIDDESKEPQATGMTLRSGLTARVMLPPETPDDSDSDKESKSSGDSDKETKSKKKKK